MGLLRARLQEGASFPIFSPTRILVPVVEASFAMLIVVASINNDDLGPIKVGCGVFLAPMYPIIVFGGVDASNRFRGSFQNPLVIHILVHSLTKFSIVLGVFWE